jgi:hypothetical protein
MIGNAICNPIGMYPWAARHTAATDLNCSTWLGFRQRRMANTIFAHRQDTRGIVDTMMT